MSHKLACHIAAALVSAAVLGTAGAASAAQSATTQTGVTLTAGTLDFTTAPTFSNFPSTLLTGTAQTVRTTVGTTWGVNDARGSGVGWNVTVSAPQLQDGAGHTLPAGSLQLRAPATVLPDVGNVLGIAAAPTILAGPYAIDGGAGTKIVSAATGKGLGSWSFSQTNLPTGDLSLTIPGDAQAGNYTTTVTFTLGTTP